VFRTGRRCRNIEDEGIGVGLGLDFALRVELQVGPAHGRLAHFVQTESMVRVVGFPLQEDVLFVRPLGLFYPYVAV